jgi:MFS family permease
MYFSGALAMTGGNFDFGLAIFVASITDVVPSHSDRVSIFFILSSMLFVAQLICPPLGGILLDLDGEGGTPWVPYLIADAFMICAAILCIVAYPETLQTSSQEPQQGPGEESPTNVESSQAKITAFCHQRLDKVKSGWTYFRSSCAGLGLSSLFILGVAMLCFTIGVKSIDWYGLMQYATWKLKWGASEVCQRPFLLYSS